MLDALTQWLADPVVHGWYLTFCVAVMIVPMTVLAIWYHSSIRRSEGGRALMRRQSQNTPFRLRPGIGAGIGMARDIEAGRFGVRAKAMQRMVYWVCGAWIVVLVVCFSLLIYADEVNKAVVP